MKRFLAALAMLTLTGCISQDWSQCPDPENVILRFQLEFEATRASELTNTVRSIDLVLFTDANEYVTHKRLEYDELAANPTTTLSVAPGRYRVVCWGNIMANSDIFREPTLEQCYVRAKDDSPSGCPLYYAPAAECDPDDLTDFDYTDWEIIVPSRGSVTKDLTFVRAHRRINVYIRNFEDETSENTPAVEATNLAHQYGFRFDIHPSRRNYLQTAVQGTTPTGDAVHYVSFTTPYGEITDNIHLNVQKQDGTVVTSVNLQDYIAANPATRAAQTMAAQTRTTSNSDIDIYVRYTGRLNTDVVIEAFPWSADDIEPVW